MQKIKILFFGSIIFMFSLTTAVIGKDYSKKGRKDIMLVPMGVITLKAPKALKPKRAAVEFPHAIHFETSCKQCHHKWEGPKKIKSCQTSGCHDLKKVSKKEPIRYYKMAFHKQCIGCHKEIKKRNEETAKRVQLSDKKEATGPTGCIKCHPKN